jgi:hypothetical protein
MTDYMEIDFYDGKEIKMLPKKHGYDLFFCEKEIKWKYYQKIISPWARSNVVV